MLSVTGKVLLTLFLQLHLCWKQEFEQTKNQFNIMESNISEKLQLSKNLETWDTVSDAVVMHSHKW